MRLFFLLLIVGASGCAESRTPGAAGPGVVCGADVCGGERAFCAFCDDGPVCAEEPEGPPDWWGPGHACDPTAGAGGPDVSVLYCDGDEDCGRETCAASTEPGSIWTYCSTEIPRDACAAPTWGRPTCRDDAECPSCSRGCERVTGAPIGRCAF